MTKLASVFRRECETGLRRAHAVVQGPHHHVERRIINLRRDEEFRSWPRYGVPDHPGRTALRRESTSPGKKLAAVKSHVVEDIRVFTGRCNLHTGRDKEWWIMFACAHPALDRQSLLALTLRLVSGVGLRRDRSALLQTDTVVGQRITGVKKQDSAHQHPIAGAARRAAASAHA